MNTPCIDAMAEIEAARAEAARSATLAARAEFAQELLNLKRWDKKRNWSGIIKKCKEEILRQSTAAAGDEQHE